MVPNNEDIFLPARRDREPSSSTGVTSPLEAHGSYRGADWSPERLVFHNNLETFAERVGLIVGLQSNGKLSQEQAYAEIRKLWKSLRASKGSLLKGKGSDTD